MNLFLKTTLTLLLLNSVQAGAIEKCDIEPKRDQMLMESAQTWERSVRRALQTKQVAVADVRSSLVILQYSGTAVVVTPQLEVTTDSGAVLELRFFTNDNVQIPTEYIVEGIAERRLSNDGSFVGNFCRIRSTPGNIWSTRGAAIYFSDVKLVNRSTGVIVSDVYRDGIQKLFTELGYGFMPSIEHNWLMWQNQVIRIEYPIL